MDLPTAVSVVVGLVPQWYEAGCGPENIDLVRYNTYLPADFGQRIWSHRKPTPGHLVEILKGIAQLHNLLTTWGRRTPSICRAAIEEHFVELWLQSWSETAIDWRRVLDYSQRLRERTYENEPVSLNLVVDPSAKGQVDITAASIQKILDPLAGSPHTFLVVDGQMGFVDYGEVRWDDIHDGVGFRYYPEFLHPLASQIQEGRFGIHQTRRGDLIVMGGPRKEWDSPNDPGPATLRGMLAAKRKGEWKLYDQATFKNSILGALECQETIAGNLMGLIFDLSFRRHGALLVYDPKGMALEQVTNPAESRLDRGMQEARAILASGAGEPIAQALRAEKTIELASLDGALIFDDQGIRAVGAMIKTHECVRESGGARSRAAESAYRWGARPIKISSDGEVTIWFTSKAFGMEPGVDAKLDFL